MNSLSKRNGIIIVLLLLLCTAFTACNNSDDDQENNPDPTTTNNMRASCDLTYRGADYSLDGFGSFTIYDTSLVFTASSGIDTIDYTSAVISIAEGIEIGKIRTFSAFILNYTGPGTYNLYDFNKPEDGGLYWIWYTNGAFVEDEVEGFGSIFYSDNQEVDGQITITKDNSSILEGNFTLDARGVANNIETEGIMQGSFTVEK